MLQLAVHLYVFARHACFLILPVRSLLPCLAHLGTRCEAYLNGVLDELVSENITAEMDDDTLSLQTAAGHEATRLVAEFQQNVADGRLAIFGLRSWLYSILHTSSFRSRHPRSFSGRMQ